MVVDFHEMVVEIWSKSDLPLFFLSFYQFQPNSLSFSDDIIDNWSSWWCLIRIPLPIFTSTIIWSWSCRMRGRWDWSSLVLPPPNKASIWSLVSLFYYMMWKLIILSFFMFHNLPSHNLPSHNLPSHHNSSHNLPCHHLRELNVDWTLSTLFWTLSNCDLTLPNHPINIIKMVNSSTSSLYIFYSITWFQTLKDRLLKSKADSQNHLHLLSSHPPPPHLHLPPPHRPHNFHTTHLQIRRILILYLQGYGRRRPSNTLFIFIWKFNLTTFRLL